MDARLMRALCAVAACASLGAGYRTQNFLVTAPTPEFAREVAETSEALRRDLAIEWLGRELPPWDSVCPISVQVGSHLGAGGVTSFMFTGRHPSNWTMSVQGSRERILDSVLPHEVTHTIFATHFGGPLPRWADEGACTTVEHDSERDKQHRLLYEFLTTGRGIAFNQMFAMREYPADLPPLYAQGYSVARYLIMQGGKRKFVQFVGDGMRWNNWTRALQTHYGVESLSSLQVAWVDWVRNGSPALPEAVAAASPTTLVAASTPTAPATAISEPQGPFAASGVTSVAAKTSWYARVRDESASAAVGPPPAAQSNPQARLASLISSPERTAANVPVSRPSGPQSLGRPQPIERAQQRVVEWSNSSPPGRRPATVWR